MLAAANILGASHLQVKHTDTKWLCTYPAWAESVTDTIPRAPWVFLCH